MRQDREPAPDDGEFEARLVRRGPRPTVVVRGDVDLATGPELEAVLDAALELAMEDGRGVELDLAETTFLDSFGVLILLRAHTRLGQVPEAIVLRNATPGIQRILHLAGVAALFTILPTD